MIGNAGLAAAVTLAALCGVLAGLELGRVLGPCAAQGVRGWLTNPSVPHYPLPYQTLSGVFATNSGIAPHAALPHPLAPPKHMHHVWVRNGTWDHSVRPFRPNNTSPKTSQNRVLANFEPVRLPETLRRCFVHSGVASCAPARPRALFENVSHANSPLSRGTHSRCARHISP